MDISTDISVAPLQESDLQDTDHVFRLAFGTFLGLPDPLSFFSTADLIRTRWLADPSAAFGAKANGEVIGSVFATNWGSVGFFGPLTIKPSYWDKGIGRRLLEQTMDLFDQWNIKHAGLYTFAQSTKHVGLYQKFGFWPRYLTAIMSRPVRSKHDSPQSSYYSTLQDGEKSECRNAARGLTGAILEGLDVDREIRAVDSQQLGDTVLLWDDAGLAALAVCHCGESTEAGRETCYIKFGAVRPGPGAPEFFDRLLLECEKLAARRNLSRLVAGANIGRYAAYTQMLKAGFRTDMQGVAMQKPNEPGYNRPEVFLIDDWR